MYVLKELCEIDMGVCMYIVFGFNMFCCMWLTTALCRSSHVEKLLHVGRFDYNFTQRKEYCITDELIRNIVEDINDEVLPYYVFDLYVERIGLCLP